MPINKNVFLHESDKAALDALKSIPGFTPILKGFMKSFNDKAMHIQNMSTNIRIDERQLPKYHDMLKPICEKLGIAEPDLYLTLNVVPNAYTSGDDKPYIVMTSGLLETMPEELIPTVLAHECGHIACQHVLYRTMGQMILNGSLLMLLSSGLAGLISIPLRTAFAYWMRCSEFSADRAAIMCDGTPDKLVEMCMRFAGFDKNIEGIMNKEAFIDQAKEYRELIKNDSTNQAMEFMMFRNNSHPINAIRALEAMEWAETDSFKKSMDYFKAYSENRKPDEFPISFCETDLLGKDYKEVIKKLEDAGLQVKENRITEKNTYQIEAEVTEVLIDGSKEYKDGDWYKKDSVAEVKYYLPMTRAEIDAMHPGQVRIPNSSAYYIGKDYREVEMELLSAGIVNSNAVPIKDLDSDKDIRFNKVNKITINGNSRFFKDEYIDTTADVVFTYHTLSK